MDVITEKKIGKATWLILFMHMRKIISYVKRKKTSSPGTPEYFKVKPEGVTCTVKIPQFKGLPLLKIFMIQLPINCNISTTGHKLQGKTLKSLIVNSWEYKVPHWIYVVLSRVRSLNCLVLNEKLDEARSYDARTQVLQWEKNMKEKVERKTFKARGRKDYEQYLMEEQTDLLTPLSDAEILHNNNNNDQNCKARIDTIFNYKEETNPSPKIVTQDSTNIISQDFVMSNNDMSAQYIVNYQRQHFKVIDVPGDGDCFYHSVLKVKDLYDRFRNDQTLRAYLTNSVLSSYDNDLFLQNCLHTKELRLMNGIVNTHKWENGQLRLKK